MADKKLVNISRERFVKLTERFAEWRDSNRPLLRLAIGDQYSGETTLEATAIAKRLRSRLNLDPSRMHLGGLKMRSDDETRDWLKERFQLGVRFAHASYAGTFEVHDNWNRRRGDFQHLLRLQTLAAEIGMELGQYMFVTRSTYPYLDALLEHLEALPSATERFLLPFSYIGWAREHEDDRILEEHRDALPKYLRSLFRKKDVWKSEREWMDFEYDEDEKKDVMLRLDVDESNIEYLETTVCEKIVEDLEKRTRDAYRFLPAFDELRHKVGEEMNLRIYASRDDIERKWLDIYLQENPIQIDRKLTHLAASV